MEPVPDPCIFCGNADHQVIRPVGAPRGSKVTWAQSCTHCHILTTAHWLDGAWMGRWLEAGRPGPLGEFRAEAARKLREEWGGK